MKHRDETRTYTLGVLWLIAVCAGCSGRASATCEGCDGGAGNGGGGVGTGGRGGTAGAGGIAGAEGTAGAGGAAGAAATNGGAGGSNDTCPASSGGPFTTWDTVRRTLPWTFVPAGTAGTGAGGTAGASGVGGAGGAASDSRCSAMSGAFQGLPSVRCSGVARVQTTANGPELLFDDASRLRWDPTGVPTPVTPPAAADGSVVWVDYSRQDPLVCPFCGTYHFANLEIRDRQGGQVLWIAREGHLLDDLSAATEGELFGVLVETRLACQQSRVDNCSQINRRVFDHLIQTTPVQVVHHASLQNVLTPNGQYDVFWAYSEEDVAVLRLCLDGPQFAHDTGFAASRVLP